MSNTDVAREACLEAGLSPSGIQAVHEHATAVFVHKPAGVVIRVSSTAQDQNAALRAVAMTGWLVGHGFPATAPAPGLPPIQVRGRTVTFWRYYPQLRHEPPPAGHLGYLLRDLHRLPQPPIALPPYPPLKDLAEALTDNGALAREDKAWLLERRAELVSAYQHMSTVLGTGLIHGDAYPGNMLWDGDRVILSDWDEVATGARELDLINIYLQGKRFGRPHQELRAFATAYGYDVTLWPGFSLLIEMRSLHTLGSFIRLAAAGSESAQTELAHRIYTLKAGQADARWHPAGPAVNTRNE